MTPKVVINEMVDYQEISMQLEVLNTYTKHSTKPVHFFIESRFRQIASFAMNQLG